LIELNGVTASYGTKTILRNVSLTVRENDFLGVVGPNGGGKTTLLKLMLGLLKPSVGRVVFYDEGGRPQAAPKAGYLPQISRIDRHFPISVYEVIASGLMICAGKKRWGYSEAHRRRIDDIIARMGLERLAKRAIGELSGGELQRVLLSRAMVAHPKIVILDEPDTYVDKPFARRLCELLKEINRDTAVVLVSHDREMLLPLAKSIVRVNKSLSYHPSGGNRPTDQWLEETHGNV
jgi:zinc transport system ATP-binding protein